MVKDPSPQGPETMSYWEALKKIKHLKPREQSLGILGFFLVTVFCFICCFFYLDYKIRYHGQLQKLVWLGFDGLGRAERLEFLETDGEQCDLFSGEWVWDEQYPLYQPKDCRFLDEGFRCSENGRPDSFYTKWRWQPKDCNLPRFDAKKMLEKLQNRRLVFVGDSIGRNQWESLLCMLSSAIPNGNNSIYEVNGSPITKHKGFLVFKFREFNCTVEYYRAPFLVLQSRPPEGVPGKVKTTLKLDKMDWTSVRWRDADVLIFNTGHWWNFEKTIRGGCYFQEGEKVEFDMSVESAYQKSIRTLVDWIGREVNTSKTQIFFRTFAPVHFSGGDWRTGGSCHLETLPELGSSRVLAQSWSQFSIASDVLKAHSNKSQMGLAVLNITHMTSQRKDGHSSLYYLGHDNGPVPIHKQDCSHWCLPGVPDAWNELLYALFLKREVSHTHNSAVSQTHNMLRRSLKSQNRVAGLL